MATPEVPPELLSKLLGQISSDPGIPLQGPTIAAWQEPAHALADVHSDKLPECVDFAIIGSGITGCSVAKTLLEHDAAGTKSVTVFDARRLTTGATSRNGGFLMSHAPTFFAAFAKAFGTDTAAQIARYCERTLGEIVAAAKAEDLFDECQIRDVETVITFADEDSMAKFAESVQMYQGHVPEFRGTYNKISKEQAEKDHGLKNIVGAFTTPSRVFWPYRLITGLHQRLLARYPQRFSIETNTPVTSVAVSTDGTNPAYPYVLTTPRGVVRASKVFHCTSGFVGHLLPKLRGPVFPCRLTMACDRPGPQFGNRAVSWLWHVPISWDPETNLVEQGLYWMQQNAQTGDLFYGGDTQKLDDFITSNDTSVSVDAAENLKTLLPGRIFATGWADPDTGAGVTSMNPRRTWCGILSMTADQVPIVGHVPASLSGRDVDKGEWVAVGFNGYGMGQCWSAGEAIARMALGEDKPAWLPDVYLSGEARLTGATMSTEAALQSFFER
ncbi:hypothetical protein PV08_09886 [Exophiala spinifera]|uniref:FAD dependent oxidoreductase domain-containing protein n=1 Tax=Exophiala spinifera TaxID=91928 RepID=A0A0D2B128_9EURO|nr:uncharacterized protein PV08_09886 [Exophiala spinifera]KIW12608.1 hypothetical protein PV08_09886 [Exophiala spinifera]